MSLANNTTELNAICPQVAVIKEEYGKQTNLISQIKAVLEQKASGEIPPSKLTGFIDGSLTEVTVEDLDGITTIRNYAFCYSPITSIEIPNSVTNIGNNVFQACSKLTSITIPNSVKTLGNFVFQVCSKLTYLTIPNSVTQIGSNALAIGSTTNKGTIRFLGTTPPSIQSNTFTASQLNQIIVPKGCGDTYKQATNWSNFADYIVEIET